MFFNIFEINIGNWFCRLAFCHFWSKSLGKIFIYLSPDRGCYSPWARGVLFTPEWDKLWPNAFWFRGHLKVKNQFLTNHFLGSRRPLDEIPQVGCLSRSGVNKSVWRDGLLCNNTYILSRARGAGLHKAAMAPGRDETRSSDPLNPYTGGLVLILLNVYKLTNY